MGDLVYVRFRPRPIGHHASSVEAREPHGTAIVACVALTMMVVGLLMARCERAEASEPLPDIRPTLEVLDRADRLVWEHRLTVETWRNAGRRP